MKKNIKLYKMKVITHNGKIHADECASVSLLSSYYANKGITVSVLRSRNTDKFLESDCLVDVGGEYNHDKLRYDHHQPDFNETWKENKILLSSAGLIWRHYGKEIVEMYLSNNVERYDYAFNYTETTISELMDTIYEKLIMEIDANDNGIPFPPTNNLNIYEIIDAINGNVNDDETQNINFNRAVSLIGNIFDIKFREIINGYFNFQKDLNIVRELVIKNLDKQYLVLEKNIPTIFKCLNEIDVNEKILFCIFYNSNDEYTVKTRRTNNKKFLPLCPILNEEILRSTMQNPEDIIFIHKAAFLAKTKTLSSAEEIVNLSLKSKVEVEDVKVEDIKVVEEVIINKEKDTKLLTGLAVGGILALSFFYFTKNDSI